MTHKIRLLIVLALTIVIALVLSACSTWVDDIQAQVLGDQEVPTSVPTLVPTATPVLLTDEELYDIAETMTIRVYEQVSPSVVHVTSHIFQMGFFGMYPSEGTGSGFVIDKEGHIVTNYHVIRGAKSVEVTLLDHTMVEAQVVGIDEPNDLAVIRVAVAQDQLQPVDMSFGGELKVGQRAIAIGNPFGLDWTLTSGVISSLGRPLEVSNEKTIYDAIQTDAAINPGNSGGPLLNSRGQLIGVNTAIQTEAENIGFAVSIDTIHRIIPALIEQGYYPHPWLGVVGYTLSPELARRLDLAVERGLLIARVYRASPAADQLRGADGEVTIDQYRILTGGDIIVAVNDVEIGSSSALDQYLETQTRVDQAVEVVFYRGGERMSKTLTLAKRPD